MDKYKITNWLIFILLSLIWGSSFILMKEGLVGLSPYQVGSIRIVSAGLVLLPVALKYIRLYTIRQNALMFASGLMGSLIPSYLFCIGETRLDSSTAGVLNALTPVFVILFGAFIFRAKIAWIKILGMVIALGGSILLYYAHPNASTGQNALYVFLIILATVSYGFNVNIVQKYLLGIPSLHIAAIAFGLAAIPATTVLGITGFFSLDFSRSDVVFSTLYACVLGILGTAIATVIFYMLMKRAGMVFASMVTYCIPLISFGWGMIYGEQVGLAEAGCMLVILIGVWLTNRKTA